MTIVSLYAGNIAHSWFKRTLPSWILFLWRCLYALAVSQCHAGAGRRGAQNSVVLQQQQEAGQYMVAGPDSHYVQDTGQTTSEQTHPLQPHFSLFSQDDCHCYSDANFIACGNVFHVFVECNGFENVVEQQMVGVIWWATSLNQKVRARENMCCTVNWDCQCGTKIRVFKAAGQLSLIAITLETEQVIKSKYFNNYYLYSFTIKK